MHCLGDKISSKDREHIERIRSSSIARESREVVDVAASFLVDGAADEYLKSKESEAALQEKSPHLTVKSSMGSPDIPRRLYKGDSTGSPEGSRLHGAGAFIRGDEEIFDRFELCGHTNFSSKPNLVLESPEAMKVDSHAACLIKYELPK